MPKSISSLQLPPFRYLYQLCFVIHYIIFQLSYIDYRRDQIRLYYRLYIFFCLFSINQSIYKSKFSLSLYTALTRRNEKIVYLLYNQFRNTTKLNKKQKQKINRMGNVNSSVRGTRVYDSRSPSQRLTQYNDGKIIHFYTRGCRLGSMHGSYSWLVTFTANVLTLGTSDPLQHWWVIVQTTGAYYTIQKWKPDGHISIYVTYSWRQANQTGLCCAGKNKDADQWYVSAYSGPVSNFTIGEIIDGIKVASTNYNFLNSNCQDFCVVLYNLVVNKFASSSSGRYPNALLGFIPLGLKD